MTEAKIIQLKTTDGIVEVTITPVIESIGDASYLTGIYKLHEGPVGMGEILYNIETGDWEYTGIGELTHEQQEDIVNFIIEETRKEG